MFAEVLRPLSATMTTRSASGSSFLRRPRLPHDGQHGQHVVLVAGEHLEIQRDALGVEQQPHLHDRAAPVLLADAAPAQPVPVFVLDLEVVVGDVVVQAGPVAPPPGLLQRRVHVPHQRIGVGVDVVERAAHVVEGEIALAREAAPPFPRRLLGGRRAQSVPDEQLEDAAGVVVEAARRALALEEAPYPQVAMKVCGWDGGAEVDARLGALVDPPRRRELHDDGGRGLPRRLVAAGDLLVPPRDGVRALGSGKLVDVADGFDMAGLILAVLAIALGYREVNPAVGLLPLVQIHETASDLRIHIPNYIITTYNHVLI